MEELIISLLKEHGRIIVPDFGAFIVKTKSPFKAIFNEFLQYNDGALIGAAASKLNIERDDAANKIKEYVASINARLDSGEHIDFPEIGTLTKSTTGKIALGEADKTTRQEKPGSETSESKTVEFDLSDTKEAAGDTTSKKTPAAQEVKKEKTQTEAPKTVSKTTTQKPVSPKPEPAKPTTSKPAATKSTAQKPTQQKNEVAKSPGAEPTPLAEYYTDDSSGNKRNIILWIVAIVIVNGAIISFFLLRDEIEGMFSNRKNPKVETTIQTPAITESADETTTQAPDEAESEVIIEEPQEESAEAEQPAKMLTGNKYYVVAGVFREESNADNLVAELKKKGYNAEKFGKIGAMHAVSYDVFPTKQEADRMMLRLQKELDPGVWIKTVK